MKKRFLLFPIIIFFIFQNNVKAFKLECDNKVANKGDIITCNIFEVDTNNNEEIYISSNLDTYQSSIINPITKDYNIKFSTEKAVLTTYYITAKSNINPTQNISITVKTPTTTTKAKSSNNYLSSIKINNKQIDNFSRNKTKYYVTVSYDTKYVNIGVETEDSSSVYKINGPSTLSVVDNEYTIGVTSEDGTTKYYKLIITREEKKQEVSTKISDIKISNYNLKFDGHSKTYYLKVKENVKKLNIKVILEDDKASYKIKGNKKLKDGSVINIIVSDNINNTNTYRIIINKEKKQNYITYVLLSFLIVILFIIIFIVINKKLKKKNNKKKINSDDNDDAKEKTKKITKIIQDDNVIDQIDDNEKTKILNINEK